MAQRRSEIFLTLTDNLFTFSSDACECMTDTEHISKTEVKETLKVRSLENAQLRFAYAPEKGLVKILDTGAVGSERILTEMISLPDRDRTALESFFENYGFFFPISREKLEAVEMNSVWGVVNRVKAVALLMSELESAQKNYKKILALILYLLMEIPAEIKVSAYEDPYVTCCHPFYNAYRNLTQIPEADGSRESFSSDTYQIKDTIYNPQFSLNINDYNDIISGASEHPGVAQSDFFKNITYLYRNAADAGDECRQIIDFLFHFQSDIGIITSWNPLGKLTLFENETACASRYREAFGEEMKEALLKIAKVVIKEELDYNLSGVLPVYDIKTMAPSWYITDLLTGLYFAVFYMRPGVELYRHCANTSCNRYFLIKTTSTKQKYCDTSCGNAASQRNHRKRVKERSEQQ